MTGDILRLLQIAAVFEVGGNARGPEGVAGVIALDPRILAPALHHRVSIRPAYLLLTQPLRPAHCAAEERTVFLLGDPCGR